MPRRSGRIPTTVVAVLLYSTLLAAGGPIVQATTRCETDARIADASTELGKTSNPNKSNPSQFDIAPESEANTEATKKLSVNYSNGRISINARGARLSDIFLEIHKSTGVLVSGPTSTEELVSTDLCGAPDEVIADLLNGSTLQYIVVFSAVHAGEVEELILSEKEALKPSSAPSQITPTFQAAPLPREIEIIDSTRTRAQEDSTPAAVVTVNSGVPDGWKPGGTGADAETSASTDGNTSNSTEKQLNPAGQYLQEMYRLRQQVPQGSVPVSH